MSPLKFVILGLSITSSWGNGHATTYRSLVRELHARGHDVLFLERDVPWYRENRDLPAPPYGRTHLYESLEELRDRYEQELHSADVALVGSYVPEGTRVGEWVTATARGVRAFYDIDTPVTLRKLEGGDTEYLSADLIPRYDLYLSFTGGPTLQRLEQEYGAPRALAFYCSVDPAVHYAEPGLEQWDLGYLGTYAADRQPALERLLIEPARCWREGRFCVAGPQFPEEIAWPANVTRVEHLAPAEHRHFYNSQRYTLNVTRADMVRAGYSPSVRIVEAAACATPIISDYWTGLETVLEPGREVLIANSPAEVLGYLCDIPEAERVAIGKRARARVLVEHTSRRRAEQLESYVRPILEHRRPRTIVGPMPAASHSPTP